jgi:hypothetical protein
MNQDDRVLGRKGARELTPRETERIHGAVRTETVCTIGLTGIDGDVFLGEC